LFTFQINKSRAEFWNNFEITWEQCADLPKKKWVRSVVENDGKVYISVGSRIPYVYDSKLNHWSELPAVPCVNFSLVIELNRSKLLAIGGEIMSISFDGKKMTNKIFQFDANNEQWLTPYPNMQTARCHCSCIAHGSSVIVAGGLTSKYPIVSTRAVEVLHITDTHSYWSIVEQLPHARHEAVLLIVDNNLYIVGGYDNFGDDTRDISTASLPQLLQSSKNSSGGQVWNKLPDMPCTGSSINHYCGCLIVFTGDKLVQRADRASPVWALDPFIYIYNDCTKSWDCVGEVPCTYLFGLSVHLKENKIMFVGGLTGAHSPDDDDDVKLTCMLGTFMPL